MSATEVTVRDPRNLMKWVAALLLLASATLLGRFVPDLNALVEAIVVVVLAVMGLGLVLWTQQGRQFLSLFAASRIELRKVVWPTKPETWQTTLIVLVVVVIASLILWGMDSLFGFAISAVIE